MSPVSPLAQRVEFPASTTFEQVGDALVPWTFESLEADYRQIREEAGAVDLSGAGLISVSGTQAGDVLEEIFTRDVMYMTPERTAMGLFLHEDGRPVDAVTLYRTDDEYLVETSIGSGDTVLDFLRARAEGRAQVTDLRDQRLLIGIEGPKSIKVLGDMLAEPLEGLPFQGARESAFGDSSILVTRTGVTGEFGFKFLSTWDQAADIWSQLVAVVMPCGHEALETAMLEVRQPLVLREVHDDDTVQSAGLNWLVDIQKPEFAGREALLETLNGDVATRRVTIVVEGDAAPRTPVWLEGEALGHLVFARYSPTLEAHCGVASVTSAAAVSGLTLTVGDNPDDGIAARTVSAPAVTPTSWDALRG